MFSIFNSTITDVTTIMYYVFNVVAVIFKDLNMQGLICWE